MPTPSAPAAYAQIHDVEARYRPLSEAERSFAQGRLLDASIIVDSLYPGMRELASSVVPPPLVMVVAEMVRRSLVAPVEGYTQDSPGAVGTVSYANPQGNLYLTKSDRSVLGSLLGSAGGTRRRAFAVDLWD